MRHISLVIGGNLVSARFGISVTTYEVSPTPQFVVAWSFAVVTMWNYSCTRARIRPSTESGKKEVSSNKLEKAAWLNVAKNQVIRSSNEYTIFILPVCLVHRAYRRSNPCKSEKDVFFARAGADVGCAVLNMLMLQVYFLACPCWSLCLLTSALRPYLLNLTI